MAKQDYQFIDPASPKAGVFLVGRNEAAAILQNNTHNRPIHQRQVDALAEEIRRGNWQLSPDALAFDVTGTLINGQHRLWAVVEVGSAVLFQVMTGLAQETFTIVDCGRPRTGADALAIEGNTKDARLAAAIVRHELAYLAGETWVKVTPREIAETARKMPNLGVATATVRSCSRGFARLCAPSAIAWVYMHALDQDSDAASAWLDGFASGANLDEDDPRHALRGRFLAREGKGTGTPRKMEQIHLAWLSWSKFHAGEKVSKLKIAHGLLGPALWPQISKPQPVDSPLRKVR